MLINFPLISFDFHRVFLRIVLLISGLFYVNAGYANDDLWKVLQKEGDALELMAIVSLGDSILLVGAKYEEQVWRANDGDGSTLVAPVIRKQLHLINFNLDEKLIWSQSYPVFPDVNEIFSVSVTGGKHICIAYGRHYRNNEVINPVVLQLEPGGKIIWANTEAIPGSSIKPSPSTLVQVANLDSIKTVGTEDSGCGLGYILRRQTVDRESLEVNLLHFDNKGNLQWHFNRETDLYGKMFIAHDQQAKHFAIVQTNQSRDAAIEAMMAARAFTPHTSMSIVSSNGELVKYHKELQQLSNIWVKHIVDAPGERILLVGNSKSAWAGFIDTQGQVSGINNSLEGEFSHVNFREKNGYLLVRDESLVSTGKLLNPQLNRPISQLVKKKYSNAYIERKLPEQVAIQNIVPLKNNNYLILYKLGSILLKVELGE